MAKATLVVNEAALLAAVTRSKAYENKLHEFAGSTRAQLQKISSAYYQAALDATNKIFQEGPTPASRGRSQLTIALPNGRSVRVPISWPALSEIWRMDKARRAGAGYRGKHASVGRNRFWLDEGELRSAFAGWIPGRAQAFAGKPRVRPVKRGAHRIEYTLDFRKLPIRFLDSALRRALLQGAGSGKSVFELEDMTGPAGPPRGLYRAFWPEALRPTMRPLAFRLGKAMQQQILKTLRRR